MSMEKISSVFECPSCGATLNGDGRCPDGCPLPAATYTEHVDMPGWYDVHVADTHVGRVERYKDTHDRKAPGSRLVYRRTEVTAWMSRGLDLRAESGIRTRWEAASRLIHAHFGCSFDDADRSARGTRRGPWCAR